MSGPPCWSAPPPTVVAAEAEVHVWRASLDLPPPRVRALLASLAHDERDRAERFHFQVHRDRFIAGRGLLRAILARYLGRTPDQLRFSYSPHGKPAVAANTGAGDLRFNVSHSDGLALYAITRGREIGVDVECLRPDFVSEEIARRFFSPREVAAVQALPAVERHEAFFACWTRKEAYIKARGEGLSMPLERFDVSLAPGEPAALLSTLDEPAAAARWSLWALDPGPGYAAALAAEGHGWRLRCWQWPEGEGGAVP